MTTSELNVEDPTLRPADEVVVALGTDPEIGLSAAEVSRRLAEDGPNELRAKPAEPFWHKILRQFQDPLVYLLLAAILISLAAWIGEGATSLPVDAIVIALIVVANAVIGLVQEAKADGLLLVQRGDDRGHPGHTAMLLESRPMKRSLAAASLLLLPLGAFAQDAPDTYQQPESFAFDVGLPNGHRPPAHVTPDENLGGGKERTFHHDSLLRARR